jgi:hypothetical protein
MIRRRLFALSLLLPLLGAGCAALAPVAPAEVRAALAAQPAWNAAVDRIAEREVLSLAQLASLLGRPPFIVGGMMSSILAELARAGVTAPFAEEQAGTERTYRWRRTNA